MDRMRFAHKGLRALYEEELIRGLPQNLVPRIRRIVTDLSVAIHPRDMDLPGYRLHPLKGDRAGQWAIRVSANWRIVFRFEDGEAIDVDFVDYR